MAAIVGYRIRIFHFKSRLFFGQRSFALVQRPSSMTLRLAAFARDRLLWLYSKGLRTLVKDFWTVHFDTFGPSSLRLLGRPLCDFWTVHFDTFGSSSLRLLDRPLFPTGTAHFHTNDRPLRPMTVQFSSKDRPFSSMTVHFGSRPSTFARPSTFTP